MIDILSCTDSRCRKKYVLWPAAHDAHGTCVSLGPELLAHHQLLLQRLRRPVHFWEEMELQRLWGGEGRNNHAKDDRNIENRVCFESA